MARRCRQQSQARRYTCYRRSYWGAFGAAGRQYVRDSVTPGRTTALQNRWQGYYTSWFSAGPGLPVVTPWHFHTASNCLRCFRFLQQIGVISAIGFLTAQSSFLRQVVHNGKWDLVHYLVHSSTTNCLWWQTERWHAWATATKMGDGPSENWFRRNDLVDPLHICSAADGTLTLNPLVPAAFPLHAHPANVRLIGFAATLAITAQNRNFLERWVERTRPFLHDFLLSGVTAQQRIESEWAHVSTFNQS